MNSMINNSAEHKCLHYAKISIVIQFCKFGDNCNKYGPMADHPASFRSHNYYQGNANKCSVNTTCNNTYL